MLSLAMVYLITLITYFPNTWEASSYLFMINFYIHYTVVRENVMWSIISQFLIIITCGEHALYEFNI